MSNYTGHFDIKIEIEEYVQINFGEINLKLKFTNEAEKKEWFSAFGLFHSIFSQKKQFCEIEDSSFIPSSVHAKITEELEIQNWQKIKQEFDYSMFIQDKSLKSLLDEEKLLKNRLLIAKIKFEGRSKRTPYPGEESQPKKPPGTKNSKDMNQEDTDLVGNKFHCVLLSQRPIYPIDQNSLNSDYEILGENSLPNWMVFGCLYLFRYTSFGDKSEFKHSLSVQLIKQHYYRCEFQRKISKYLNPDTASIYLHFELC